MSAEQDNKAFITGVLNNRNIDFSKCTFGIWISSFQHINYGTASGYAPARPLVEDLVSAGFSITGQTFNFVSTDGKSPAIKIFLTSGVKGINGYESLAPKAELSNTYFSGMRPVVVLPDMDFAGKLYRRYEVTGYTRSSITSNNILCVSGEDWEELPNSIYANNTDQEYSYEDANYSGYSNQSVARYKFLYNDSGNSQPLDIYEFEFPLQLEDSSVVKYRLSRKSDPLGTYQIPYFTADGKVVIDYSQYKDEISGVLDGKADYEFDPVKTVSCSEAEIRTLFSQGAGDISIVKPLTGQSNPNESLTGVRFYKSNDGTYDYLNFSLLSTGEYTDIYKATISVDRFYTNSRENIQAYVLTGYNIGDGNNLVYNLQTNDLVYPRVIEDGRPYSYTELSGIIDITEVVTSELSLQDIQPQNANDGEGEDTSPLAETIENNFRTLVDALNDKLPGDGASVSTDTAQVRAQQDTRDQADSISQNASLPIQKSLIPNYPLPKKTYTSDTFSNYLNSGESYVLSPLAEYPLRPLYASYGNSYGWLGYSIFETDRGFMREVSNTTCGGIYVDESEFCNGGTASYGSQGFVGEALSVNGSITEIPSSDGIIKKSNYTNSDSWLKAINYFYQKNYVASFDIYPSFGTQDYAGLFTQVFTQVKERIGGPNPDDKSQDSFNGNGGTRGPRIFVEREIYTEDFNEAGQIEELIKAIGGYSLVVTGVQEALPEGKLYSVQSYDASDFTNLNTQHFLSTQDYTEQFNFSEFMPDSGFAPASFDEKSKVLSYSVNQDARVGNLYFFDANLSEKKVFRAEYVTGSAEPFTYANYSNAAVWNGSAGGTISIPSFNLERYSYHLFQYTSTNKMKLVKENVKNGDAANGVTETNATVLKFQKTPILGTAKAQDFANYTAYYLNIAPQDSTGALVDATKIKFNVQAYDYNISYPSADLNWVTLLDNPINDNAGKAIPTFFEDLTEAERSSLSMWFEFPNGPHTSKNYEGTPVSEQNINALQNGLFKNSIVVKEAGNTTFTYDCDYTIDFQKNSFLVKGLALPTDEMPNVTLDQTKRLKIVKIKYNFYVKDLVIVGDAGFPESSNYNSGWEYKLQYRKSGDTSWKTMGAASTFSKDKFSSIDVTPSPYFYNKATSELQYLGLTAFRTNLPLYLDDNGYEFRIAKYEKLTLFTNAVNVFKKTNFLPTQVSWTENASAEYYNIYQKDREGKLSLIKTLNNKGSSTYALPDINQRLVNLGSYNFGGINGSGYYDIVVSGIVPSVSVGTQLASTGYGFAIGNSDEQVSQRIFVSGTNFTPVAIGGVSYAEVLNFNNPETRTTDFNLEPKYDGFYFVSSGASVGVSSLSNRASFEGYVLNLGASAIRVGSSNIVANDCAIIGANGAVTTTTKQTNPAASLDLGDISDKTLVIKEDVTITNASAYTSIDATVINDSASSRTITFSTATRSVAANTTVKLRFSSTPSITVLSTLSNYEVQNSKIYQPQNSFVNANHNLVELGAALSETIGVLNNNRESLSFSNASGTTVGSVPRDSFSYLSWNGTTATITSKDYFDDLKIYLKGNETRDESIIVIRDDFEVVLSSFNANFTGISVEKSYFFIKDSSSNRDFNIKIRNGSSIFAIPTKQQNFKLTVKKQNGAISYKILYAADDPVFQITDAKEQLIIVERSLSVSKNYLKNSLASDTFLYLMNVSDADLNFYDTTSSAPDASCRVGSGKVAKVYLQNGSLQIKVIDSAFSHLSFDVNPATHLASSVNILDLQFCGTDIKLPAGVTDIPVGKDLFLICRNRTTPNKIAPSTVIPNSIAIDDAGLIPQNSIALRVYRNGSTDAKPTIEPVPLLADITPKDTDTGPSSDAKVRHFYIDDDYLESFTLRDFYNRKFAYNGAIFLPKEKAFSVYSFDRNSIFSMTQNDQSKAISFDYYPDLFANGRLTATADRAAIHNDISENSSSTVAASPDISNGDLAANFAYDKVTLGGLTINKNRILSKTATSSQVFGLFNEKEFFLPKSKAGQTTTTYYQILPSEENIDYIILPESMSSSGQGFVIKNSTSRTITVRTVSYTGSSYEKTLAPGSQTLFTYTTQWPVSPASNTDTPDSFISVSATNQNSEIDTNHPLLVSTGSVFDLASELKDPGNASLVAIGSVSYAVADANSGTVPSVSGSSRLVCFGRTSPEVSYPIGTKYVVNNFFLFMTADTVVDSSGNKTMARINKGQVYDRSTSGNGTYTIIDLEKISRKSVDLTKFADSRYFSITTLPTNWLIPISDNLRKFYLPNLDYPITNSLGTIEALGVSMVAKAQRIIFVNCVQSTSTAASQVVNYSDSTTESLYELNSLVVYEAKLVGSSYVWQKVSASLPTVQVAYPKLKNLKGLTRISTPDISSGNEFVYLPNVKTFGLDIDSFSNKEFGDILLFNSAVNNLSVSSNSSALGAYRFGKISNTGRYFRYTNVPANGPSSFSSVDGYGPTTEGAINAQYPNLSPGSFIKYVDLKSSSFNCFIYSKEGDSQSSAKKVTISDSSTLNIKDVISNDPNKRLFIYGTAFVSESNQGFFSYDLVLKGLGQLGNEKFFIYNASRYSLNLKVTETFSLSVPANVMIEIYQGKIRYSESHRRGAFFVPRTRDFTNYINKIGIPFVFSSATNYRNVDGQSEVEEIPEDSLNIAATSLSEGADYVPYSEITNDHTEGSSIKNKTYTYFSKLKDFVGLVAANHSAYITDIIKTLITIGSTQGHYIFNSSSSDIKLSAWPSSSESFFVNNCAQDIRVALPSAAVPQAILYRNSVMVVSSSGNIRYLKKAKRRDEFYCVLNPNAAVVTQREITMEAGIPRTMDVLPILDANGIPFQSYVKLISKNGQESYVYLSLRDYYNGKDIPTDSYEDIVAYELGIGHETIYKFLFYNPQNAAYTMPGIKSGFNYRVEIDDTLYRDLNDLIGVDGTVEDGLLQPMVKYNGTEFYYDYNTRTWPNGQTFVGGDNPNYEVRYPNYVKVYRVVYEVNKDYPRSGADDKPSDSTTADTEPQDTKALLVEQINLNARDSFGSPITWLPMDYSAFWSSSESKKEPWIVQSITPTDKISIAYPEGTTTSYANFVKCTVKKTDFKSPIFSYQYDYFSALQPRSEMADPRDLIIGLDGDLDDRQAAKIKSMLNSLENREDYLLNVKEFLIGRIQKTNLIPEITDTNVNAILKAGSFDISVSVSKLGSLPSVVFDDMSNQGIIKIINAGS